MNLRTKKRFQLHRLDQRDAGHFSWGLGLSVDDGNPGGEGGGGEGNPGGGEGGAGGEGNPGGDGKRKPTDEEAKLLKEVMQLKDASKTANDAAAQATAEVQRLKDQLKNYEGIDAVKVRELLKAAEEDERKKLEAKGEYDRLIKQMGERHAEELKRAQEEREAERESAKSLRAQIADITVGGAFSNSPFVREDLTLTPAKARVVYGAHFEFSEGKVIGYDKPAGASDRTPLVDSTGKPLSFDEALKAIVEADPDKDQLLRSKMKAGAGSGGTAKPPKKGADEKNLTGIERIAKGLKALANPK